MVRVSAFPGGGRGRPAAPDDTVAGDGRWRRLTGRRGRRDELLAAMAFLRADPGRADVLRRGRRLLRTARSDRHRPPRSVVLGAGGGGTGRRAIDPRVPAPDGCGLPTGLFSGPDSVACVAREPLQRRVDCTAGRLPGRSLLLPLHDSHSGTEGGLPAPSG